MRDPDISPLSGNLRNIATDWEETSNREEADNRIYCNNGDHFTHRSKHPDGEIVRTDRLNNVYTIDECSDFLYGFVSCEVLDTRIADKDDFVQPCTVTICDSALRNLRYVGHNAKPAEGRPYILSELAKKNEIQEGLFLDDHAGLASLLFHEVGQTGHRQKKC